MLNKKIILILIFILLIVVLLRLNPLVTPKPTPTPSPIVFYYTPSPIVTILSTATPTNISFNNIISQLPIVTPEYTIEYFPNTKKFIVLITENPYEENKKIVESWFKEQGVEDLSKINLYFGSSRGVAP